MVCKQVHKHYMINQCKEHDEVKGIDKDQDTTDELRRDETTKSQERKAKVETEKRKQGTDEATASDVSINT